MHPHVRTIRRRICIALGVLAGAAVVVLSWRVPEPETHTKPAQRIENISYMQCASQDVAPPNYGTRTLDNECIR